MTLPEIFFVGPLPPPLHGFAEINRRMLTRLQQIANVAVFDDAPRRKVGLLSGISPWIHLMSLYFRFVVAAVRGKSKVLYLPLSGGYRQLIDSCFAVLAILLGMRIFVHHHTFSYLNRRPFYARIVLRLLRNATHIVLGECMGELLCRQYGISTDRIRVVSNAAFLEDCPRRENIHQQKSKLVVGFLSNITRTKGCFDFIELVKEAVKRGLAVEGVMAGPVQSEIQQTFANAVRNAGVVQHIGPVYGADKTRFFEQIDVLVFPSHDNEAEPVTIWEALAANIPVIALSRGCISSMVPSDAGWVIDEPSQFIEQGIKHLRYLLDEPDELLKMKVAARSGFEAARFHYSSKLDSLLLEMKG